MVRFRKAVVFILLIERHAQHTHTQIENTNLEKQKRICEKSKGFE